MKKQYTEIIFVIDRSGSMYSIVSDMIGGFNSFISQQKLENTNCCKVSLFQFDSIPPIPEKIYEAINLDEVLELTKRTFVPRGGTPLYDAIATVVKLTGERFDSLDEIDKPDKVLMVIITDGKENASSEWTADQVKEIITHQKEKYSWDFVYLGANQDAWSIGTSIGIDGKSTSGYAASAEGTRAMWDTLSKHTSEYRSDSKNNELGFFHDLESPNNLDTKKCVHVI